MIRFVHTADVQLTGTEALDNSTASLAWQKRCRARFEALHCLLRKAQERQAHFVLICGDLFESNLVSPVAMHEALKIFKEVAPLPVYILPGNHDPYTKGSVYQRSSFWANKPDNVIVLDKAEPLPIAENCLLYPCPVRQKRSLSDPTAWIPQRSEEERRLIRLGAAHGSLRIEGKFEGDDHPIAPDAWRQHDLDYLALGHWHSSQIYDDGRMAYPGTPEQTAFEESGAGQALLVSIESPGALPVIEPLDVGQLHWLTKEFEVHEPLPESLQHIQNDLDNLAQTEDKEKTLLRLKLTGAVRADSLPQLEDLDFWLQAQGFLQTELISRVQTLEALEGALRQLVESDAVVAGVVADLQRLALLETTGGAVTSEVAPRAVEELMEVWQQLKAQMPPAVPESAPSVTESAQTALQILAKLISEVTQ